MTQDELTVKPKRNHYGKGEHGLAIRKLDASVEYFIDMAVGLRLKSQLDSALESLGSSKSVVQEKPKTVPQENLENLVARIRTLSETSLPPENAILAIKEEMRRYDSHYRNHARLVK